MSFIWQNYIINPLTNLLLILYDVLFDNFFLALVAFTAIVRLAMIPLSLRQQRSMAKTQEMQPQIQAIQKKYRDDPARMQEEFTKIGYNPADSLLGCLPLLLQMPIFFGLYRAIIFVMSSTPQGLYQLSERASDRFIDLTSILPIDNSFAWLNLAQPDQLFILPVLVGGSMFLQQKLMTPTKPPENKKKSGELDTAASMQQSMQVTMPLMFGFMAMQFPSGLSIYFVISNLIGMVQGFIMKRSREQEKILQAEAKKHRKKPKAVELEETTQPVSKSKAKSKSKKASAETPEDSSSGYSGGLFNSVSLRDGKMYVVEEETDLSNNQPSNKPKKKKKKKRK